jgi:hypothetical protein|tara:strand:- start:461 stop:736 length:276 start_codon:yes stop_codon:yes gene_type:complete
MEKIQILENIIIQMKDLISTEKNALLVQVKKVNHKLENTVEILTSNDIKKILERVDYLYNNVQQQNQRICELENKIISLSTEKPNNPFDNL